MLHTMRRPTWAATLRVWTIPVLFFALLTAVTARIVVPLPFTPVPITLQVMAVLISGLVLGSRAGAISQLVYLGAIASGLPLAASGLGGPAAFLTPTAGYLVAFVPGAFVAGWLVERLPHQGRATLWGHVVAGVGGVAVIYLGGASWLAWVLGDAGLALRQGVLPFIGVDLAKAVVAALVAGGGRLWLRPPA